MLINADAINHIKSGLDYLETDDLIFQPDETWNSSQPNFDCDGFQVEDLIKMVRTGLSIIFCIQLNSQMKYTHTICLQNIISLEGYYNIVFGKYQVWFTYSASGS